MNLTTLALLTIAIYKCYAPNPGIPTRILIPSKAVTYCQNVNTRHQAKALECIVEGVESSKVEDMVPTLAEKTQYKEPITAKDVPGVLQRRKVQCSEPINIVDVLLPFQPQHSASSLEAQSTESSTDRMKCEAGVLWSAWQLEDQQCIADDTEDEGAADNPITALCWWSLCRNQTPVTKVGHRL